MVVRNIKHTSVILRKRKCYHVQFWVNQFHLNDMCAWSFNHSIMELPLNRNKSVYVPIDWKFHIIEIDIINVLQYRSIWNASIFFSLQFSIYNYDWHSPKKVNIYLCSSKYTKHSLRLVLKLSKQMEPLHFIWLFLFFLHCCWCFLVAAIKQTKWLKKRLLSVVCRVTCCNMIYKWQKRRTIKIRSIRRNGTKEERQNAWNNGTLHEKGCYFYCDESNLKTYEQQKHGHNDMNNNIEKIDNATVLDVALTWEPHAHFD